jgi:hypothetical protein
MRREATKLIEYDDIELIKPEKRSELLQDLQSRTGIKINRIHISEVNFLRDTALITIYYYE